jgi:hypothetical protein
MNITEVDLVNPSETKESPVLPSEGNGDHYDVATGKLPSGLEMSMPSVTFERVLPKILQNDPPALVAVAGSGNKKSRKMPMALPLTCSLSLWASMP